MYLDKNTIFSGQESITASGSSKIVDLYPGYSGGDKPFILALASDYAGEGSLEIELETANDSTFAEARRVAAFPISAEQLKNGGEILAISLPRNVDRYVRLNYVISGVITELKLNAMLVLDI